jgi:DNA topoisomerase I
VTEVPAQIDNVAAAREAGLRHVDDSSPGIRRVRRGDGFVYLDDRGEEIRDSETLLRIRHLAVPPAWTDVWICPSDRGHIQATGRDARGRKQYRYHARWREVRDAAKYERSIAFARALPRIRRRVDRDLRRHGLPREKVIATAVRLLETTLIRVGNEEYAQSNRSFGLTTLRTRHANVRGATVRFLFRGKSGVEHTVGISDRRVAAVIRRCQDLPGQRLLQYVDADGMRHAIDSDDVNAYLREAGGGDFTAKDFRTWAGTVLAARALGEFEQFDSQTQAKRNVLRAIEAVAKRLGNTRTVCHRCYVHPAIIESYMDGSLARTLEARAEGEIARGLHRLPPEEAAVLALLQQRLRHEGRRRRPAA